MFARVIIAVSVLQVIACACPECVKYNNPYPVHFKGTEKFYECSCVQDLSGCPTDKFLCPAGQMCTIKPIPTCTFTPCGLKSAVCEPFTSCPAVTCADKCSVSGYIRDPNNCQTCSCVDPCKETTCPVDKKCIKTNMIGTGFIGMCY
ncbi:hypothetical protein HELRODRAFT_169035 [Helobdella robusta]|uniref:Antistasin-like domain-containing protein n=1 Tax=Helobdella robusta TaxID=6412 RepID=T1F1A4_HELRO|nr:hypothetical protein HELRODRAFT_169035 [Helobdella robusta]ESO09094.1 hypothetical protein HELRODRAFT_169035 [Helobdella robusta]